jgi:hypothetical protein
MNQIKFRLLLFVAMLVTFFSNAQTITGPGMICVGGTATYMATPAGGTWSSSMSGIATISSFTGVATGIAAGMVTFTYTLPSSSFSTVTVTVTGVPISGTISGPSTVCAGSTIGLSSTISGGSWTSASSGVATVSTGGIVTGVTPGICVISYTVGTTGCTSTSTYTVSVTPGTTISSSGPGTFCTGGTLTLTPTTTGGAWTTTPATVATVSPTGVLVPLTAGVVFITYTLPGGCFATLIDTIYSMPAAIGGPSTVCAGATITQTNSVSGGVWLSSTPSVATIGAGTGLLTGVASGTATIYYTVGSTCSVSRVITVNPGVAITGGGTTICVGATATLGSTPSTGGTWSTASSSISLSSGGVVTGVSAGVGIVTYVAPSGCFSTVSVTVVATPPAIGGTTSICVGGGSLFTNAVSGGIWSSTSPAVGTIVAATGMATGIAAGTTTISYTLSAGCATATVLTVNAMPTVTATATPATCGNSYTLTAGGGTTYLWSPGSGLSCMSCASPTTSPTATATYTVIGTTAGCSDTAYVTVTNNRIYGHITFSGATPITPSTKVWLVKFNPSDSSITATDSTTTCIDAGTLYYNFDSKPSGNYLVKAKLLSSIAGTSDYIPTYGLSTPNWYMAGTIAHTTGTDVQDITMIYGTVPSGPGFIGGYVYSGAGKGTAGDVPVQGMLVYLKNTAGQVLTYAYTNASGGYSFSGIAYGTYIVYPEAQSYYTTPSAVLTLSAATSPITAANFRQYMTSGVILPYAGTLSSTLTSVALQGAAVYPNPAKGILHMYAAGQTSGNVSVTFTDMTGRVVRTATLPVDNMGAAHADLTGMNSGAYILRFTTEHTSETTRVIITE